MSIESAATVPVAAPPSLLTVDGLKKYFPARRGLLQRVTGYVKSVDGVSFAVAVGETLGIVGESGCGKTTLGRCMMRLIEPTAGQVTLRLPGGETAELTALKRAELRRVRPHVQMVFQDPQSSLNGRMTVGDLVAEPLVVNRIAGGQALTDRIVELLEAVGMHSGDMRRYPHAFSGGQRQRIGIARALALRPSLIVADEPVSSLDVSVQAQVLNLLVDLRDRLNLSYVFIAHDLGVVEHISHRVAVMYLGRIVEMGPTRALYATPRHPYTEALLSAVPLADPAAQRSRERIRLVGDVPSPINPPSGCHFRTRCRYAQPICAEQTPPLAQIEPGRWAACHFAYELALAGVAR